jgi:hypothetical protein
MKHNIVIGLLVMVSLVCAGCVTVVDKDVPENISITATLPPTPEDIPEDTLITLTPTPTTTLTSEPENTTGNITDETFILDYERGSGRSGRYVSPTPTLTPTPPVPIPEFSSIGFVVALIAIVVIVWQRKK